MPVQGFTATMSELDDVEVTLGEIGTVLSRLGHALALAPDSVMITASSDDAPPDEYSEQICVRTDAWPTIQEIGELLSRRRMLREALAGVSMGPVVASGLSQNVNKTR